MSGHPWLVFISSVYYNFAKVTHEDSCAESSREACVKAPCETWGLREMVHLLLRVSLQCQIFEPETHFKAENIVIWHLQFWAHHKAEKCRRGPYYKARIIESSLWPGVGNFERAPKYQEEQYLIVFCQMPERKFIHRLLNAMNRKRNQTPFDKQLHSPREKVATM